MGNSTKVFLVFLAFIDLAMAGIQVRCPMNGPELIKEILGGYRVAEMQRCIGIGEKATLEKGNIFTPGKVAPECFSRINQTLVPTLPNHTVDRELDDVAYQNKAEADFPVPAVVRDADFFNSIQPDPADTWESIKPKQDKAVDDFRKKIISKYPNAKVIQFSSRHNVAIAQSSQGDVISGTGRVLVMIPGQKKKDGGIFDQFVQFVVPNKETPNVKTGQMSIVSVDQSAVPPKTWYLDQWRSYDKDRKFQKVVKEDPNKINGGRCQSCHFSGALAIHPTEVDERHEADLKAINSKIADNGPELDRSVDSDLLKAMPSVGSGNKAIYNDALYDSCIPKEVPDRLNVVKQVNDNIRCINCHDNSMRSALTAEGFISRRGITAGNFFKDRIMGVRDHISKTKKLDLSHAMPPYTELTVDAQNFLYTCLEKGFKQETADWLTFKDDPKKGACFYKAPEDPECNIPNLPLNKDHEKMTTDIINEIKKP